jgi:hypothetical protein
VNNKKMPSATIAGFLVIGLLILPGYRSFSQSIDTVAYNNMIVHEDYRMQILARRENEINTAILKTLARIGKGFRLLVLNTYDRAYAMKIRTELLEKYPDQKTYMWFASPYIKIKFGNFKTREEAIPYQTAISKMLNGASVYIVADYIEMKPDNDSGPDDVN